MSAPLLFQPATLRQASADFIAIAREALFNPNWPVHAELALDAGHDYATWPRTYRMWLQRRAPRADPVRAAAGMGFCSRDGTVAA